MTKTSLKTLLIRYRTIGYEPKGLKRDLETAAIIKWIYETYDIYIGLIYHGMKTDVYKHFTAMKIINASKDFNESFFSDKHFLNPYDSLYNEVVHAYRFLKFNKSLKQK